jgi:two-component system response regulator RegX3
VIRRARILVTGEQGADANVVLADGHVVRACTPASLSHHIEAFRPDLVVVDLTDSGSENLPALVHRLDTSYRPLVLCTVPERRITSAALEAGADACLEAPYTIEDLEIQVRAMLRRSPGTTHAVIEAGPLIIDESSHTVSFDDAPISLPPKEFELLVALARDAGAVLSKRTLLERLWAFDAFDENLVEVHMCCLRKLLPPQAAAMVQTVRGVGYVWREDIAQDLRA